MSVATCASSLSFCFCRSLSFCWTSGGAGGRQQPNRKRQQNQSEHRDADDDDFGVRSQDCGAPEDEALGVAVESSPSGVYAILCSMCLRQTLLRGGASICYFCLGVPRTESLSERN